MGGKVPLKENLQEVFGAVSVVGSLVSWWLLECVKDGERFKGATGGACLTVELGQCLWKMRICPSASQHVMC